MNITPTPNANHAAPHRTFTEAITICFIKFANFKGRASRSEFWWFWLVCQIVYVITSITSFAWAFLLDLFLCLPWLAVGARRLHDINRSGWVLLAIYLPFIGVIPIPFTDKYLLNLFIGPLFAVYILWLILSVAAFFCLMAKKGEPHLNKYDLQN